MTSASAMARRLRQPPLRVAASAVKRDASGAGLGKAGAAEGFAQPLFALTFRHRGAGERGLHKPRTVIPGAKSEI